MARSPSIDGPSSAPSTRRSPQPLSFRPNTHSSWTRSDPAGPLSFTTCTRPLAEAIPSPRSKPCGIWSGPDLSPTTRWCRFALYVSSRGGRRPGGRRPLTSSFPAHASGRWSAIRVTPTDPTTFATAWASQLLDRYGVVTRSHVAAEGIPGGWTALYPVFTRMEEVGRVRRGYFVEGLGGAQFALAGAVDRLRGQLKQDVVGLAATDPANPFGTILPWPDTATRLVRTAGAYVIMGNGELLAYLDRGGRRLYLFAEPEGEIARELAAIALRRRRLLIEEIDNVPASQSSFGATLTEWGFVPALKGLAFRGS